MAHEQRQREAQQVHEQRQREAQLAREKMEADMRMTQAERDEKERIMAELKIAQSFCEWHNLRIEQIHEYVRVNQVDDSI